MAEAQPGTVAVEVPLGREIDLHASLAPLGRWGDDLLDRWDGATLTRTTRLSSDAALVPYTATVEQLTADSLTVVLPASGAADAARLGTLIGQTLLTNAAPLARLCAIDGRIAALAELYPGLVPVLITDPFAALIRSISAQQVNLRWATVIRHRLATRYGNRLEVGDTFVHVLDPAALAAATVEELRDLQLTSAKARSAIAVAQAADAGELRQEDLSLMDDDALIAHLVRLPGIGRWSAEWFLARTLGRPRVVAGDLGVRKAIGRLYEAGMPSELEVRRLTEDWGPGATLAQALALHDLAVSSSPSPAP